MSYFIYDAIEQKLREYGFKREVAGANDFDKAIKAANYIIANPGKGLMITGLTGSGKTTFAKALRSIDKLSCMIHCTADISDLASPQMQEDFTRSSVIIDDLGSEKEYNEFGVKRELVAEFINAFYIANVERKSGNRLVITSNLSGEDFLARYGARVYSRLKEMCAFVKFEGKDKRKLEVII